MTGSVLQILWLSMVSLIKNLCLNPKVDIHEDIFLQSEKKISYFTKTIDSNKFT